jgi:hypothetical protein
VCAVAFVLATCPAYHGPAPVSISTVNYRFGGESLREHLEDQVGDGKIIIKLVLEISREIIYWKN